MGTFKEYVVSRLQLKHKWVRIMLIGSVLTILGIIFFPNLKREAPVKEYARMRADTSIVVSDTSIRNEFNSVINRPINRPIHRNEPKPPPPPKAEEKTIKEKGSFDWKGTITWGIGTLNALVLIFMNLKNMLTKKH